MEILAIIMNRRAASEPACGVATLNTVKQREHPQFNELTEHVEVRIDEETVWLTQAQMVMLQTSALKKT